VERSLGGATADLPLEPAQASLDWRRDGDCWYCITTWKTCVTALPLTGYTVNRGYAEYALARRRLLLSLAGWFGQCARRSPALRGHHRFSQPCAFAGVAPGRARRPSMVLAARLAWSIAVLQSWKCEVYVATRCESHRQTAVSLGATWVGKEDETPPAKLDRAITFGPVERWLSVPFPPCVKAAWSPINAPILTQMPAFDYDKLLFGARGRSECSEHDATGCP